MNLKDIVACAIDKERFRRVEDYIDFCQRYLEFTAVGIQAVILSQNEQYYKFLQYKDDGHRNVTRPINVNLMLEPNNAGSFCQDFLNVLVMMKSRSKPDETKREVIVKTIYTLQQSIGAALDALPAGSANQARKVNGDLFERLIRLIINEVGVDCKSGIVKVPVKDDNGVELFKSSYQHDLVIDDNGELKIIGSVKTSSKDRIDKIFLDKFLYSKLTGTDIPHIAIFLNDVQRAQKRKKGCSPAYGISTTFLPGHFKAFTIKLNPLDGVYYCDIRPSMRVDDLLKRHIQTIDNFFFQDLWHLLNRPGQSLAEVEIKEGEFLEGSEDDPDIGKVTP